MHTYIPLIPYKTTFYFANCIDLMAQRAIREYDAKTLWARYTGNKYSGVLVDNDTNYSQILSVLPSDQTWVVKPDQLFGKRGLYGLVGVNLDAKGVKSRLDTYGRKEQTIDTTVGILDTFLVEPFVEHTAENYLALKTERDTDIIYFSRTGGVAIEEQRDDVLELRINVMEDIDEAKVRTAFSLQNDSIVRFIINFFAFFRAYGFTYLEVNPLVLDTNSQVVCLDMVARVDTCASWQQKENRSAIHRVKGFGSVVHPLEAEIERMDAETGASLKFSTMNPQGRIGLVLGGGGASVVTMDTLADAGLLSEIINYGELSGNPSYWHNKAYVQGLLDVMCQNNHQKQRLCMIGGISNFTKIDVLCKAFVDALAERVDDIKTHHIHLLVRRGGVNDEKGLALIEQFCQVHSIPYVLADGDVYITKAIQGISL